jgi:hypothetical protein
LEKAARDAATLRQRSGKEPAQIRVLKIVGGTAEGYTARSSSPMPAS